ncbi:GNAT family N-acetyltransferase [Metasolibacillus meyeri]|uniref:GNAT family N-acetyltransferase n=1 Tax=Metasolibacillus meyeri TaxID=1071052 RepID=A0AAW9NPP7_9BACL|nr:GNAT family N-acetyltransferase [Metasolibacillus meyeri]MEC1179522.1 GNAT family N-acetyltransferase [Metasolibacillus meyeri]
MIIKQLKLKTISQEDIPFLFTIYASTRKQEVDKWGWTEEQQNTFLTMQWQAQQASYSQQFPQASQWLILFENNAIGRCIIEDLQQYLHLIDLSILPNYQGKGIGTTVLKRLQQMVTQDEKPLCLKVLRTNPAKQLYERLGFKQIGVDELYVEMQWNEKRRRINNGRSVCRRNSNVQWSVCASWMGIL